MQTVISDVLRSIDPARAFLVAVVEAAIPDQELSEGDALPEAHLAASLGASRSPVHDALKRLAYKGLVQSRGRRGSEVATFSPDQIADFFGVREVLEGLAARLAAERIREDALGEFRRHLDQVERFLASRRLLGYPAADGYFHGTIARAARSPQLDAALAPIQARLRLLRRRSGASTERTQQALLEHRAILPVIEPRNADEAEVLMRAHIRIARTNLMSGTDANRIRDASPNHASLRKDGPMR